ncbi:hypothetical protein [Brachybacterium saurashtrense]|nr:hypothetical protein [Brachybacterium saurashtrense]
MVSPDLDAVRQLLRCGDHIEVLAPAARRRIGELAADLAARHSSSSA